jgi:hypothetical protein
MNPQLDIDRGFSEWFRNASLSSARTIQPCLYITPLQTLFGFERVHVPKGKTVKVYLGSTIRDFVQVNQHGKHHAVPGEYMVQFGVAETAQHGMGFATTSVIAV